MESTTTGRKSSVVAVALGVPIVLWMAWGLHVPFEQVVSFGIGYYWIALLLHPDVEAKVSTRQYRFSFIRMVFMGDKDIRSWASRLPEGRFRTTASFLMRGLPPVLLVGSLQLLSGKGNTLLCVLGCLGHFLLDLGERKVSFGKLLQKFEKKI
jgi:hypothetical protein